MKGLRGYGASMPSPPTIIAGIVVICALVAVIWLSVIGRGATLRGSAVGFDGLAVWLRSEGLSARSYEGWSAIDVDWAGLRVLPLFDVALERRRSRPRDVEALIQQETEIDIAGVVVRQKLQRMKTLVVLPKWRTGMRLSGFAHPDFRDTRATLSELLQSLSPALGKVQHSNEGFASFLVPALPQDVAATLYAPQTVEAGPCEPLVGTKEAMVLGRCDVPVPARLGNASGDEPVEFYVLSDPDLMNNHGLAIGENAKVVTGLMKNMSNGEPILIDYTTTLLPLLSLDGERREREWSDLLRFFGPPFQLIWIGAGILAALVLWRGSVRYGAALAPQKVQSASKVIAINAKAKLLRLSGNDAAVVAAYVDLRIKRLADQVLGARPRSAQRALTALTGRLKRRDRSLAEALSAAVAAVKGARPHASPSEVADGLDRFETAFEKVRDDIGRTRPRP